MILYGGLLAPSGAGWGIRGVEVAPVMTLHGGLFAPPGAEWGTGDAEVAPVMIRLAAVFAEFPCSCRGTGR